MSKRYAFALARVRCEVLRVLHSESDFDVCLERVCCVVERFNKRCLPLSFVDIVRLKGLHCKIWCDASGAERCEQRLNVDKIEKKRDKSVKVFDS